MDEFARQEPKSHERLVAEIETVLKDRRSHRQRIIELTKVFTELLFQGLMAPTRDLEEGIQT